MLILYMPVYTNYKERKEDIINAIDYYINNDITQLECSKKFNLSPQIFEYYYNKYLIQNKLKEDRKKNLKQEDYKNME